MNVLDWAAILLEDQKAFIAKVTTHIQEEDAHNLIQLKNRGIYLTGAAIATVFSLASLSLTVWTSPLLACKTADQPKSLIGRLNRLAKASYDVWIINTVASLVFFAGAIIHPDQCKHLLIKHGAFFNQLLFQKLGQQAEDAAYEMEPQPGAAEYPQPVSSVTSQQEASPSAAQDLPPAASQVLPQACHAAAYAAYYPASGLTGMHTPLDAQV